MVNRLFVRRTSALIVGGAICFMMFIAVDRYINWFESASNVETVSWLPETASDVSYTRTSNWRIFEFTITADGFNEWASNYRMAEIAEPFYISRFNATDSSIYVDGPESEIDDLPSPLPSTIARVTDGLEYHAPFSESGGVYVCYDRCAMRAYFHARDR